MVFSNAVKTRPPLLQAGMQLTVAGIIAGVLGYVFQIFMGRLLVDADFAVFSALNALSMVVSSPLSALVMLIARRVASLQAAGAEDALPGMYRYWQMRVAIASLVLAGLLAWSMPTVQGFVKTTDTASIWLFFGIVALNALVVVNIAFFQGLHRFGWLSGLAILIVIMKIACSAGLITAGDFGVRGALAGMLSAAGLTWAFGLGILWSAFPKSESQTHSRTHGFSLAEAAPVVCATVGFTVLSQLDVPLANHFFEPSIASAYAAAAVLGKAVLYLPGGLVVALLPMVAANETRSDSSGHLLLQSVVTTVGLCGAVAAGYVIYGDRVISALYGGRYSEAGGIVGIYGFAMVPLTLVLVMKHFFIAMGRKTFLWLLGGCSLAFICGVCLRRPSVPQEMIMAVAVAGAAICFVGALILTHRKIARSQVET